MRPSVSETFYSLYGAWRLLLFDRSGWDHFDKSIEGFWKSFFAAVLVAPPTAIMIAVRLSDLDYSAGPLRLLLVECLAYVISWTAFPVIMHALAPGLGRASAYVGFIVAFNWAKVIQTAIYLPIVLLSAAGFLPEAITSLLYVFAMVAVLGYQWFVTRTALDLSGAGAAGIVALDLIVGLVLIDISDGMLR
ncbi:MAG: hypothetical protein MI920_38115 [Kiloniellales bacterium]|nr:hypothetical protein [Kiloniellales bacterium]